MAKLLVRTITEGRLFGILSNFLISQTLTLLLVTLALAATAVEAAPHDSDDGKSSLKCKFQIKTCTEPLTQEITSSPLHVVASLTPA